MIEIVIDHDPLCRQKHWTGGDCFDCRLIARVRADEQAKALEFCCEDSGIAHAEAVAARLVEVICEQDDLILHLRGRFGPGIEMAWTRALQEWRVACEQAERERDAARAEAAQWRTIANAVQSERDELVEVRERIAQEIAATGHAISCVTRYNGPLAPDVYGCDCGLERHLRIARDESNG